MGDDALDHRLGQPRDPGQQPVAAGLQALVEVERLSGRCSAAPTGLRIEEVLGVELGERRERLIEVPAGVLVEVVLEDEPPIVLDARP